MTQRLDPRSDRPLALQLADLLRAEIQGGQRRPGSQLPTESEFQHAYGVSRTTVRAALATLASEGLVLTRKGFGSYVRSRPPMRRVSSTDRHASHRDSGKPEFETEAIAQGQAPSRRMLMTGRGPVPGDIATWLGVEAGEEVVIRQRLQLLDDVPAVFSTSYYPLWVADGTRLDWHAAARIVWRVARRAGIAKKVGPHTLRHAFITAALDAGVGLRDVQEAASHADPRTTMRYDRARVSRDRHATYIVATFIAGAAR